MVLYDKEGPYILRASITLPDGSKRFASDYGKRAFKIRLGIRNKRRRSPPPPSNN